MEGKNLNRLKLMLVEKKGTSLWIAEQFGILNTLMEKKTNKAAKQIVHAIISSYLNPTASIVLVVKATVMLVESFYAVGEDSAYQEMILKNTIAPARQVVRETILPELGKYGFRKFD